MLRPDWIDAMVRMFDEHENAGLVGPRLIFPTGAVQSVGGIFDGKGEPWHRWLGWADARDARVSKSQPVSWITGAAFMMRREDFLKLGGLDAETYPGGYWEDTDVCMKVRHVLGKEVWYCADATLVHEVGSTGGNPQFMDNARRFHERWDPLIEPETHFVYAPW